jgi:osmotically-inducible protein OsmY
MTYRGNQHRGFAVGLLAALLAATVVGCTSMPRAQSPEEAIEDGVVTARVKAALTEDPVTSPHGIKVETFKGTVQLSGYVETPEARNRALKLARSVGGVKQVRDALELRKSSS